MLCFLLGDIYRAQKTLKQVNTVAIVRIGEYLYDSKYAASTHTLVIGLISISIPAESTYINDWFSENTWV